MLRALRNILKPLNRTSSFIKGEGSRLHHDERGGIAIFFGLLLAFVLFMVLKLTIEKGIDLPVHSNLENRLAFYNKIAAAEWRYYRLRAVADQITNTVSDRPGLWIPSHTVGDSGAIGIIKQKLNEKLQEDPALKDACVTYVNPYDVNSRGELLFDTVAFHPASGALGGQSGNCCAAGGAGESREGCLSSRSKVLYGLGDGSIVTTPFEGDPQIEQDLVVSIVSSLDSKSIANIPTATAQQFVQDVYDTVEQMDMFVSGEIYSGLSVGANMPSAITSGGGRDGGMTCTRDPEMGWSGCAYDTVRETSGAGIGGAPNCDQSRKWPLVGEFFGHVTRRCDADRAVWTYESEVVGTCYTWRDVQGSWHNNLFQAQADCNNKSNNCDSVQGWQNGYQNCGCRIEQRCNRANECGWNSGGEDVNSDGSANDADCPIVNCWHSSCSCGENESECGCAEEQWRAVWKTQNDHNVYRGHWYHSCPYSRRGQNQVYKDLDDYLIFHAFMTHGFNPDGSTFPVGNPGNPSTANGNFQLIGLVSKIGLGSNLHQRDEMNHMRKKNTDKSWTWACSPEARFRSRDGEFGLPYGDVDGVTRNLVNLNDGDSGTASATNCRLPAPPAQDYSAYRVKFVPSPAQIASQGGGPACNPNNPTARTCDFPEGIYLVTMAARGLKPPLSASGNAEPPGGVNTTLDPPPGQGGWAWDDIITPCTNWRCARNTITVNHHCPVADRNRDRFGNNRLANYVYDERQHDPIPGEYIFMTDILMETSRPGGGISFTMFDDFDDLSWGPLSNQFIADEVAGCENYPWFCGLNPAILNERPGASQFNRRGLLVVPYIQNGDVIPMGLTQPGSNYQEFKTVFEGGNPYGQKAVYVGNLSCAHQSGEPRRAVGNIPMAVDNIPATLDGIGSTRGSLDRWATGHGASPGICSLLKVGAHKALSYGDAEAFRALLYIGSCPNGWGDAQLTYRGTLWNAFSTSNATGGVPGEIMAGERTLLSLNNSQALSTPLHDTTLQCFNDVRGQLDYMMVFTDGSCPDFLALDDQLTNPWTLGGTRTCDFSTNPGDCVVEFIRTFFTPLQEVFDS